MRILPGGMVFLLVAAGALKARTFEVGSGKLRSIQEAAQEVKPGDVVVIYPGIYRETVRWRGGDLKGPPITVRGTGSPRPILDGTGLKMNGVHPETRSLFEVEGDNFIFENIEFRNARNGQNASGVRVVRARKTVLRNIKVTGSDMGIMSSLNDELLVEHSEIAYNGTPLFNGASHNLYLDGDRARIQYCYIHDSTNGQNIKARTRYIEYLYNYIADAHDSIDGGDVTKELGFQPGPSTRSENGHAVLIGNIIVKRGTGIAFLDFGPDGSTPPRNGTLFLVNNTIVRESRRPRYMLRIGHEKDSAVLYNNIFYGFQEFARGGGGANLTGSNNWFPEDADVPPQLKYTFRGKDPGFINLPGRDYRLAPGSVCIDQGGEGLHIRNAAGADVIAAATLEYRAPMNHASRPKAGRIDIGALEHDPAALTGATGILQGVLVDQTGKPVAGNPVLVDGPTPATTRTDAGGAFKLTNLQPGAYKVTPWEMRTSWAPSIQSITVSENTAPIRMKTAETRRITGIVTNDGTPMKGIPIFLEGAAAASTITGPDGRFAFTGLPPGGAYTVRPVKDTLLLPQAVWTLPSLQADAEIEIKGRQQFIIGGLISDAAGKAVRATVTISGSANVTAKTDGRGNYKIWLIKGGSYTVTPSAEQYRFDPPSRTISLMQHERKTGFTALRAR